MSRILIEKKGTDPKNYAYGLPWRYDATCFNFRAPNEMVDVSEINRIDLEEVETLVIGCDLDDYGFIGKMVNLRQLYIYTGSNIQDISFVRKLKKLSHLYIRTSHIKSLEALKELIAEQKRCFDEETDFNKRMDMVTDAICIESEYELDGEMLLEPGAYISELRINGRKY